MINAMIVWRNTNGSFSYHLCNSRNELNKKAAEISKDPDKKEVACEEDVTPRQAMQIMTFVEQHDVGGEI